MRKIILASHGEFSKGLLDSVKMIVGDLANCVSSYSLYPGQSASDFALELEKIILEDKECEYIILSDLYGASVCTAMLRLTNLHNVNLFSGMNLNMVLELLTRFSDKLTTKDVEELVKESRMGIQSVTLQIKEEEEVF
ncbi:PTS mannose transporter subunit IIC [Clostridioides difficile]|uniref:PTS sugar transporter subunit IIA n=1 Tax=unclassified Clostridioides TaxID=2635829 RepID=UPI00143184EB|nr:PTS mannose transporter subunit IIC [Clostridioides difficile]MDB3085136.1 PTS mannose transporter subunit IIC [Clostridioides difficile]MDI0265830.1 PTS mannose transporter subunit IIC [Clostridioides difficile]NJI80135.1 PTS mannose transporter subunit IIC [Clostridioides difficile]NJJ34985.1 PTS mannose transporter subunit IIC [Clostridioides difficile]